MKTFPWYLLIFGLVFISSCQRNDDEPIFGERPISRLYISTSDYDGTNSLANIFIVDPADSSVFPEANRTEISQFTSSAKGGSFINFDPYNGLVFHGSQNSPVYADTAIQVMTVSPTGVLKNTNMVGNRRFDGVRGIASTVLKENNLSDLYLLFVNSSRLNASNDTDTMFVVSRPQNQGKLAKPTFYMPLDYNSWKIVISDRDVLVSSFANSAKPNVTNGIVFYKNLLSKFISTVPESPLKDYSRIDLNIEGAKIVRGISYSKELDLLVVTDTEGEGAMSKGRILFFQNFSSLATSSKTIKADRIVTSSKLQQPVDIAIDTRKGAKYIYVADAIAKRVFRFMIDDSGVVNTPNQEINLFNRTPVGVSLDAR